jgi:predicted porin
VAGSNNFSSAGQQGPIRNAFSTSPNTTVRSSNSVQYILPSGLGGLEGALMVAAGEGGAAANGQHKLMGGRLAWQTKVFGISAAYATTENDLTATGKFKDSVIGTNGSIGPVRLTAALRRYEQAQARQTNLVLGASGSIGATDVKASYLKANMQGRAGATSIDDNDATQMGLGVVYNLSKRTGLYAQVARIENEGRATFVIPGGSPLPAGGRSTGWEAGLRHNF